MFYMSRLQSKSSDIDKYRIHRSKWGRADETLVCDKNAMNRFILYIWCARAHFYFVLLRHRFSTPVCCSKFSWKLDKHAHFMDQMIRAVARGHGLALIHFTFGFNEFVSGVCVCVCLWKLFVLNCVHTRKC